MIDADVREAIGVQRADVAVCASLGRVDFVAPDADGQGAERGTSQRFQDAPPGLAGPNDPGKMVDPVNDPGKMVDPVRVHVELLKVIRLT